MKTAMKLLMKLINFTDKLKKLREQRGDEL